MRPGPFAREHPLYALHGRRIEGMELFGLRGCSLGAIWDVLGPGEYGLVAYDGGDAEFAAEGLLTVNLADHEPPPPPSWEGWRVLSSSVEREEEESNKDALLQSVAPLKPRFPVRMRSSGALQGDGNHQPPILAAWTLAGMEEAWESSLLAHPFKFFSENVWHAALFDWRRHLLREQVPAAVQVELLRQQAEFAREARGLPLNVSVKELDEGVRSLVFTEEEGEPPRPRRTDAAASSGARRKRRRHGTRRTRSARACAALRRRRGEEEKEGNHEEQDEEQEERKKKKVREEEQQEQEQEQQDEQEEQDDEEDDNEEDDDLRALGREEADLRALAAELAAISTRNRRKG